MSAVCGLVLFGFAWCNLFVFARRCRFLGVSGVSARRRGRALMGSIAQLRVFHAHGLGILFAGAVWSLASCRCLPLAAVWRSLALWLHLLVAPFTIGHQGPPPPVLEHWHRGARLVATSNPTHSQTGAWLSSRRVCTPCHKQQIDTCFSNRIGSNRFFFFGTSPCCASIAAAMVVASIRFNEHVMHVILGHAHASASPIPTCRAPAQENAICV